MFLVINCKHNMYIFILCFYCKYTMMKNVGVCAVIDHTNYIMSFWLAASSVIMNKLGISS